MNKNDFYLITILLIICVIGFLIININKSSNNNTAFVYYKNKLIKEIDLTVNNTYEVKGKNGIVKIEVKDNEIRVIEEKSPKHLCSKQGYISSSNESIICLPNEIMITIGNNELDAVVE